MLKRELLDMNNILSATESAHFANLDMKLDKLMRKYDTFIPPTACSSCEVSNNQNTMALREVTELKSKSAEDETKLLDFKSLENIRVMNDLKRRNDLFARYVEHEKTDALKLRKELEYALVVMPRANDKAPEHAGIAEERLTLINKHQDQIFTLNQANQPSTGYKQN